jgi:putative transcriptional regulator
MESLKGSFLISMPHMNDPNFSRTVVYVCEHTKEGAMGLVINRPLSQLDFSDILAQMNLHISEKPETPMPLVHFGGPVEMYRGFCLHSSDYSNPDTLRICDTIFLTANKTVIYDIANLRGPKQFLFLLGYSGWAPGQLENEILHNGWITVPAVETIMFHKSDDQKWKLAGNAYGIDLTIVSSLEGNA